MSFIEEPRKSDRVVDLGGIHVYVARNLAAGLRDRVIDVRHDDDGERLVLRRSSTGVG
jgi:Fe-S cluster assembly iron-binding protein IscA